MGKCVIYYYRNLRRISPPFPPIFQWTCLVVSASILAASNDDAEIKFENLKSLLTKREWDAIIGSETESSIEVVHVDVPVVLMENFTVYVKGKKFRKFLLNFRANEGLFDAHFVAVIRDENSSFAIDHRDRNPRCYYKSRQPDLAAVDVCQGRGLKGIIYGGNFYYLISPLPVTRSGSNIPHILVRRPYGRIETAAAATERGRIPFPVDGFGFVRRKKRELPPPPGTVLNVETALFVDRDLYEAMKGGVFKNDTEKDVVRFAFALVNAVQLLYHDTSLGWSVNFVLKRLEILRNDPKGLVRSPDVDKYLSSFCTWQHLENPSADSNPLHWDHAVILSGLDLYVVSKHGKISNQVVGLAPISGMCTTTSSCTVNEGRHFESAFVVAHEIGHNLGMRHDGSDNNCDPSSYLMSPTLGHGKVTWSICSKNYLEKFLRSRQSRCLFDASPASSSDSLDHGGLLPGERFDVGQQCRLKFGPEGKHEPTQPLDDICRGLQCFKEGNTFVSHPALEGSECGRDKWCRSGRCIGRGLSLEQAGYSPYKTVNGGWSIWSVYSECASSCLRGENGDLSQGSSGIMVAYRRCNNPRPENGGATCAGNDHKYKTCVTDQCDKVDRVTIKSFSSEICARAGEVDAEILPTGEQRASANAEEACTVWCHKRGGGFKSRGWSYPDGTICHLRRGRKPTFCIRGQCKEFTCGKHGNDTIYMQAPELCTGLASAAASSPFQQIDKITAMENYWTPDTDCFWNCISPGSGMRLVAQQRCHSCNTSSPTVELCQQKRKCPNAISILEYATNICMKFSKRVRGLSGLGMQLSPTKEDPHRPCRLACQDENVSHRFFMLNGNNGWFPFGTDCSRGEGRRAFCIHGKCLEFGTDKKPKDENFTLENLSRTKRSPGILDFQMVYA